MAVVRTRPGVALERHARALHRDRKSLVREAALGETAECDVDTPYEHELGLPMRVESCQAIGEALAKAGRKPVALKRIVDDAARLALGKAATDALSITTPPEEGR